MTASEVVLIIAAVGAAIVSIVQSLKVGKQSKETHDAVNSRMEKFLAEQKSNTDEILRVGIQSAFAAGVKQATDTMKSVAAVAPALPLPVVVVPDKPVPVTISDPSNQGGQKQDVTV